MDQKLLGFFDLEMSGLNADFGILLCGVVRGYGTGKKGETIVRLDELENYYDRMWDDRELAVKLRDALSQYDIIVSYNGRRFDVPFLNTRLALYGEPALPRQKHIDLLYVARYGLRLHSARLESVQEFFDLSETKSHMEAKRWIKALTGSREDFDYIVDHCRRDVAVLEATFDKVKHLIRSIHV